jgi:maltose alpha-D-glucosyltransferase/alpha-amylase
MNWYENAVFYELYPRAFMDSDGDGRGDLLGIRQKLDYLQWLGVDVVWLLPIGDSPLRDDGYDVRSYYQLHPDFGTIESFRMLVDEVHARGMKLLIDLVVNHTSDQHPWFKEARRSKESPYRDYYVWSDTPDKYPDVRVIFIDTETSNWTYDEGSGQYYWHRFFSSQPDLNYDNPKVREEMLRALAYWCELGADAFRLDACPYLFEREGTNGESLPETHAFLKVMRAFLDANYPGVMLLGEANQMPEDLLPYFGDGDEMHMSFNFIVMPQIYLALKRQDHAPLREVILNTPPLPEGCQWATFLRNHDELTLEMVTPDVRQEMWAHYAPQMQQRINLGIRRRLAPLLDNDIRRIMLLNSLLFTLPGAPVIYYGDEIGMGDNIALSDRNGVRTPMQWDSSPNAGFSAAPAAQLYAPVIDSPEYGPQAVNVAAQREDPHSLLQGMRRLIHARKRLPLLAEGGIEWLDHTPNAVAAYIRTSADTRLLALHNLSADAQTVVLPQGNWRDVFTDSQSQAGSLSLQAYEWRWLMKVERPG